MEKEPTKEEKADRAKAVYELALKVHTDLLKGEIYWHNLWHRFQWILMDENNLEPDYKILYQNMSQLLAATVWHLNNQKDGEPTTTMGIPNILYEVVGKKLSQLPNDRVLTESEALEIARKK